MQGRYSVLHASFRQCLCAGGGGNVTTDQAEVAALLAEENVEVLTQEEADRLTQLDALTVCTLSGHPCRHGWHPLASEEERGQH